MTRRGEASAASSLPSVLMSVPPNDVTFVWFSAITELCFRRTVRPTGQVQSHRPPGGQRHHSLGQLVFSASRRHAPIPHFPELSMQGQIEVL